MALLLFVILFLRFRAIIMPESLVTHGFLIFWEEALENLIRAILSEVTMPAPRKKISYQEFLHREYEFFRAPLAPEMDFYETIRSGIVEIK